MKRAATLDGKFTLQRDCTAEGTFEFDDGKAKKPAKFRGKLKPDRQVLTGDFVIFGAQESYRFVRQLD